LVVKELTALTRATWRRQNRKPDLKPYFSPTQALFTRSKPFTVNRFVIRVVSTRVPLI